MTQVTAWRARWADPQCPVFIFIVPDNNHESVRESSLALCAKIALMVDGLAIRLICPTLGDRRPDIVIDDMFSKVKRVVDHAEEMGIDPKKVIIGGSGAGAYLAAAISMNAVLTGTFRILLHMMLSPASDRHRIMDYLMSLADTASSSKWRDMPELLLIQTGQSDAGSTVDSYADRLSGFGVRVVARNFIRKCEEPLIIKRDKCEDAHQMMILNLLFAIRRAS